jgi:hypothetical protein
MFDRNVILAWLAFIFIILKNSSLFEKIAYF